MILNSVHMEKMSSVSVRQMREDDVQKIVKWTKEEKWSLTEFDLSVFRACHPEDFFVAELAGRVVGSISAVRNDDNTGVLGAFIVDKPCRGKGIGRVLMDKALDWLEVKKGVRNSGLSGRADVVPVYVRKGFVNCVWDVIMYGGQVDPSKVMTFDLDGVKVIRVTKDNLDLLLSYDRNIRNTPDRRQYFEMHLEKDENVACIAVKESTGSESSDTVLGMAMAKPADAGWSSCISPLYADSLDVAKVLFRFLFENQPNVSGGVYFETIEPNKDVKEFMSAIGIGEPKFCLRRQFTKGEIKAPYDKIYSISNTDLHFY